jgi:hypothetical protein
VTPYGNHGDVRLRRTAAHTENRPNPDAVAIAIGLAFLGGLTGAVAGFILWMSIDSRNEPEGMASILFAGASLVFAVFSWALIGTAAVVFGMYGARRRAAVFGVVTVLSVLSWCVSFVA